MPSNLDVSKIPDDLKERDQWCLWRLQRDTKIPYSAHTGRAASSTKRDDWVTFDEATEAFSKHPGRYSGLGFVFAADDPFCGIDLDDCLATGPDGKRAIKPWAQSIIEAFYTYAEVSPSGNGIKLWCKAELPAPKTGVKSCISKSGSPDPSIRTKKDPMYDGAVEIYDHGRYFTVTGRALKGCAAAVEDCQTALAELYSRLRRASPESTTANPARDAASPAGREGIPEKITAGGRHGWLMSAAAQHRAKGYNPEEILEFLKTSNAVRCDPPKSIKELQDIVKWVCDKPAGELPALHPEERPTGSEKPPGAPAQAAAGYLPKETSDKLPPNDIARLIMRDHAILGDEAGMLYEYNGLFWRPISDKLLSSYALSYDTHQYTKVSRRNEIVKFILDATRCERINWRQLGPSEIPCRNGVVDVTTCDIRPHRQEDYLEAVVDHDYDPKQHPHLWTSVLERWFRGDSDSHAKIDALQEFFGYCLLPHARYKKALFLHGESDTGKSVVPIVLGQLVGARNKCTLSTEQMADERKRAPIVGRMVNLLTELPAEAMIADGGFKQLVSTGDPISIDPKYQQPYDYVPFCKHVICCNTLPSINDLSRATFNRLLLIRFNDVLAKAEQDKDLDRKLADELPGILAWSIEGANRLIQNNGEFTSIDESAAAITEYRREQNPVNEFIEEKCDVDEDGRIPTSEFREKFSRWLGRPVSPRGAASMLKSAGWTIAYQRYPMESGKTVRCICGIYWRPGA